MAKLETWDGRENVWFLAGSADGRKIVDAIPAAADRMPASVRLRVVTLPEGSTLLGMVHTHPPGNPTPSEADLRMDMVFVESLPQGFGVFGIYCDELRWFSLAVGDRHYTPVTITEV